MCFIKSVKRKHGNRTKPTASERYGGCPCGCYGKDIKRVPFPFKDDIKMQRKAKKSIIKDKRRELGKIKRGAI